MKKIKFSLLALALALIVSISACTEQAYKSASGSRAKNVILIIGDGMGLAHIYGAMSIYDGDMYIEKAKNIGFSKTHSSDRYITDSAASGTAMSTGEKTRNGMIGLAPDSSLLTNMTEILHKKGLAAGVVSTSAVVHATPASFVAHNVSRNNYYQIADDFLKTQPDVFIGGGQKFFTKRKDGRDLMSELKENGYDVVLTVEELLEVNSNKLAGLLAEEHMPKISEGRGDMLAYGAIKAIETLQKNPGGFFLMIEGSQIDWAAHEHDTQYILEETIDLDRTLGVVLDYAERNGETLVIVTADHETGGMTLVKGEVDKSSLQASYSVGGHTGIAVPVFAFGPASSNFTGFYDNTEIFRKILSAMSIK